MAELPRSLLSRRQAIAAAGLGSIVLLARPSLLLAAGASDESKIEPQPYFAGVNRAVEALASLGAPLTPDDAAQIAALSLRNDRSAVGAAETILRRYTLARLTINSGGALQIASGDAPRTLVEQGWRMFLVRVENLAGTKDGFELIQAGYRTPGQMMSGTYFLAQRAWLMDTLNKAPLIKQMWLLAQLNGTTGIVRYGIEIPVIPLSGIPIEYQVVQLFSQDRGQHSAHLVISTFPAAGSGAGATAAKQFDFHCLPTRDVPLAIKDADGRGCVASLTITDQQGLVYPPQAMRLAPDLSFQRQIYRADGENLRLPDGEYRVESRRGPEYLPGVQTVRIGGGGHIEIKLRRWIDPVRWGWYSGDTHIHAGGCAHYQVPTEGVSPETMIRHVRGEGLAIGDILSWGPSWYYQKQFFTGHAESRAAALEHPELQAANNASLQPRPTPEDSESVLRYDVEVSGFPSSHAGHLVLLGLKEQDYPGTKLIEDWPSWNLPILKWAQAQGSVAGYAHGGSGMVVDSTDLPNYEIPPMDGVGTQEAIVDVTHGVVDFLSGCDTWPAAELNAWYHLLNCGFRMAMIGETDFPCLSGERPGVGRSYVRLDRRPEGDAGYDAWIKGLKQGRLYCGDGRSHFLDFTVQGHRSGEAEVILGDSGRITVAALVAARLEPQPTAETEWIRTAPMRGWHLENARRGNTREVAVELVVNGVAVEQRIFVADGTPRPLRFETILARSSWVALRIMPSAHTHPVFVRVGDKPIRASRLSAQWCRQCVDKIWEVKSPFMRESELPAASAAFDHARRSYEQIMKESEVV